MDYDKKFEVEVKFRIDSTDSFVSRLKEIGAVKVDDGFERNLKFDKNNEMKNSKELLRLRSYGKKADITHKKKVEHPRGDEFKVRDETIVNIDSFERGKKLLEALGFSQVGTYEKQRQTWELGESGILIDTMPFLGKFIEIEGSEEDIEEIAGKLGLEMKDAITNDYVSLFEEYCRENGISGKNMVFSEEKE